MDLKEKILLLQNYNNIYFNLNGDKIYCESDDTIQSKVNDCVNFKDAAKNKMRLGAIGELYAQFAMESLGYEVFPAIVDDHGIDFIAKNEDRDLKIQVKTVNFGTYVYFPKVKFDKLIGDDFYIFYIRVDKDGKPYCYLYPSNIWKNINPEEEQKSKQFVFYTYKNTPKRSNPEYGIKGSNRYYQSDSDYCISTDDNWKFSKKKLDMILNKDYHI